MLPPCTTSDDLKAYFSSRLSKKRETYLWLLLFLEIATEQHTNDNAHVLEYPRVNHWHPATIGTTTIITTAIGSFFLQQLVEEIYLALKLFDGIILVLDNLTASKQLLQCLLVLFLVVDGTVGGG